MAKLALAFDILARDRASAELDRVGDSADRAGGKLSGLGQKAGVAFAAVGASAVAGAAASLNAFVGFERQMNEVFTLLPGVSQDAMDDMTGQVKDFSREFGVLPDDVVPALYQALSAGVPQDNVFEFLETAQMAARGGVTELTTAVDGISSVVNAFGSEVISAAEASDLMFTAVRLGKTNFEELSSSLSNVNPIASALGVNFADVTAGLAAMTAQGTPTAQATTQMRSLFVELSKDGGAAAKVFEDMAGVTFQQFIAEGGNTADALAVMSQAADESGKQLQDMFSSVEAGSAALSLAGSDAFVNNIEEMAASAGATEAAFDQMQTGLGPIIDKMKANLAVFMLEVGGRLAPLIERALSTVGRAIRVVSPFVRQVIDAFGDRGLSGAIAMLTSKFAELWPSIRESLREFASRVIAWVGATAPKIAAQVLEWGAAFYEWVLPQIPPALRELGRLLGALGSWILDEGLPLLVEKTLQWGGAFLAWIGPQIPPMLLELGKLLADLGHWIVTDALPKIIEKLGEWAVAFGSWARDAGGRLLSRLRSWLQFSLLPWMAKLPGRMVEALGDLAGKLWDAGFEGGKSLIGGMAEGMIDELGKSSTGPMDIMNLGFKALKKIPGFHTGGVFDAPTGQSEGLALLLDGERVLSPAESEAYDRGMLGQGGYSATVTIGQLVTERGEDSGTALIRAMRNDAWERWGLPA